MRTSGALPFFFNISSASAAEPQDWAADILPLPGMRNEKFVDNRQAHGRILPGVCPVTLELRGERIQL